MNLKWLSSLIFQIISIKLQSAQTIKVIINMIILAYAILLLVQINLVFSYSIEGKWKLRTSEITTLQSYRHTIVFDFQQKIIPNSDKITRTLVIAACKTISYNYGIEDESIYLTFESIGSRLSRNCEGRELEQIRNQMDITFSFYILQNLMLLTSPLNQNSFFKLDRIMSTKIFLKQTLYGTWRITDGLSSSIPSNTSLITITSNTFITCNNTTAFNYLLKNSKQITLTPLKDKLTCNRSFLSQIDNNNTKTMIFRINHYEQPKSISFYDMDRKADLIVKLSYQNNSKDSSNSNGGSGGNNGVINGSVNSNLSVSSINTNNPIVNNGTNNTQKIANATIKNNNTVISGNNSLLASNHSNSIKNNSNLTPNVSKSFITSSILSKPNASTSSITSLQSLTNNITKSSTNTVLQLVNTTNSSNTTLNNTTTLQTNISNTAIIDTNPLSSNISSQLKISTTTTPIISVSIKQPFNNISSLNNHSIVTNSNTSLNLANNNSQSQLNTIKPNVINVTNVNTLKLQTFTARQIKSISQIRGKYKLQQISQPNISIPAQQLTKYQLVINNARFMLFGTCNTIFSPYKQPQGGKATFQSISQTSNKCEAKYDNLVKVLIFNSNNSFYMKSDETVEVKLDNKVIVTLIQQKGN